MGLSIKEHRMLSLDCSRSGKAEINSGWLQGVHRCVSPNYDARPEGCVPELIVIHNISLPAGEFGGPHIESLFTNCLSATDHDSFAEIADLKVSAHLLIRRDGRMIQFVNFDERAWHAGVSCYQGRERCNDFSIGIEMEGTDEQPYEEVQYEVLAQVVSGLVQVYPRLSCDTITGHSHIAPGRKTDPGIAFDWNHFRGLLDVAMRSE